MKFQGGSPVDPLFEPPADPPLQNQALSGPFGQKQALSDKIRQNQGHDLHDLL